MATMTFSLTESVRDSMVDPQMNKAPSVREDRYLANINWLDEDLNNKAATTIQKLARQKLTRRWLPQPPPTSDTQGCGGATEPQEELETIQEDTWCELGKRLAEMSSLVSGLEERLSNAETGGESEDTITEWNGIKFPNTTRTIGVDIDDSDWIISREVIRGYLEESNDEDWKKHRKMFRNMIYTDINYIGWSDTQSIGEGPHRLVRAGDNHKNWRNEKKEWFCESLHYLKQLYDTMAKREKTVKV